MLTKLIGEFGNTFVALEQSNPALAAELVAAVEAREATLSPEDRARPLGEVPLVLEIVDAARLDEVIVLAALDTAPAITARTLLRPENITQDSLVLLGLSSTEAAALGNAVELYFVCADDLALAQAVYDAGSKQTNNRLARFTAATWLSLLTSRGVPAPVGTTLAAVSETISRRFERLYPIWAILGRIPAFVQATAEADLNTIAVLTAKNPKRFASTYAALDRSDVPAAQAAAVEEAWGRLSAQVHGYPGLELAAVYDDHAATTADRASRANARTGGFISSLTNVGGAAGRLDALGLDLSPDSKELARFKLTNFAAELRPLITACLRGYQRMRTVGGNMDVAKSLLAARFSSAHDVVKRPLPAFIKDSGLDATVATRAWNNARRLATDAAMFITGISDQLGGVTDPPMTRPSGSVARAFATFEGYDGLFGNQSFCDCEHCKSILGPAAYFVDLMSFVEAETNPQFPSPPPGGALHSLHLKSRRPDLWTLPLDCHATNDLLPTLSIVNEILENDIARGIGYSGPLTDRPAVEAVVYAHLGAQTASFRQPFARGLARVSSQLAALEVARPVLAQAVAGASPISARMALGLSVGQEQAIVTPRTTLTDLSIYYRVAFGGSAAAVADVDAVVMARGMAVDLSTLRALVVARFVRQGAALPTIEPARRNSASVQHDVEWVKGLTAATLDRMHRLWRLASALGEPIEEVDRQLAAASDTQLDAATLDRLAITASLRHRFGEAFTVDDAVAMVGNADQTIIDQRWNQGAGGNTKVWPHDAESLYHPAFQEDPAAFDSAPVIRLAAGLGLSLGDLAILVRYLAPVLARETEPYFKPTSAVPAERYFIASAPNLDRLDWHVRLGRLLGLRMSDLVALLTLAEIGYSADSLAARDAVRNFDAWQSSGRTLDELAIAVGREPAAPVRGYQPGQTVSSILAGALTALAIPDDLFAVALGVPEEASSELIAANAAWFAVVGGLRVIAKGANLNAAIVVPATAIGPNGLVTQADVRAVLYERTAVRRIDRAIGSTTGRSDADVGHLRTLAGVSLTEWLVAEVHGAGATPAPLLTALVTAVERMAVATRGWSTDALALFVASPTRLGPGGAPSTTATSTHPMAPWFTLSTATMLGRAAVRADAPDSAAAEEAFVAVLDGFDPGTGQFAVSAEPAIAALLGVEPTLLGSLRGLFSLYPGAVGGLESLSTLVGLCHTLGIDGAALRDAVSDDDARREAAADSIDRAVAGRSGAGAELLADAHAGLRMTARDALVDYLLGSGNRFPDRGAVGAYFLIDVEAGGCATTSRVVSATNSVQEYVNRITLGLERDDLAVTDPAHVALRLSAAGTASWTWRRAYRVWEANRKVFLWPENYLDPSIRDDKTPLFAAFEDAVAQGDLSESSLLTAFATYLRGLDDLASLQIAGAYHDVGVDEDGEPKDVLHLVGVTADDPGVLYYRSFTDIITSETRLDRGIRMSAWHKLELSVPSRVVSPVAYQGRFHLLWSTVRSRAQQSMSGGEMTHVGYRHTLGVEMASLQPDGTWTAVQRLPIPGTASGFLPGAAVDDPLEAGKPRHDVARIVHTEPVDDYALLGPAWRGVWPVVGEALSLRYRDFRATGDLDVYGRRLDARVRTRVAPMRPLIGTWGIQICAGIPLTRLPAVEAWPHLVINRDQLAGFDRDMLSTSGVHSTAAAPVYDRVLAAAFAPPQGLAISGSVSDAILAIDSDLIYLRHAVAPTQRYVARRLGTTVVRGLGRVLFERGIDGLLDTAYQLSLAEAPLPMTIVEAGSIVDRSDAGTVNFGGPFGVYLRELFFHAPMLIAGALKAGGRHADARRWFLRVFDPTSTEVVSTAGVTDPAEAEHRQLDRVWRYRELRQLTSERAQAVLTDAAAMASYREDPFNPHAIARLRLSAYKRYAFARYVDNLLDWGDSLFAQFTRETVEEARFLYQHAQSLLGPRPARLSECGPGPLGAAPTYEGLSSAAPAGRSALVAAETEVMSRRPIDEFPTPPVTPPYVAGTRLLVAIRELSPLNVLGTPRPAPSPSRPVSYARQWLAGRVGGWAPARALGQVDGQHDLDDQGVGGRTGTPSRGNAGTGPLVDSFVTQLGGTFCVPPNKTLLARWDRVADRLWKIAHCRDLNGELRTLALFAPELDPMALVAAQAAGLGPEDLVPELADDLPPYRFTYLLERAKGFASSLAGFGGALLGALERRDNEALSILRQEQALAMARLTRRQRVWDVDAATGGLASVDAQIVAAERRRDFYDGLLAGGRSVAENTELGLRAVSLAMHTIVDVQHLTASVVHHIPIVNAPWSTLFGGLVLGNVATSSANKFAAVGAGLDRAAGLAAIHAGHERRAESWRQQLDAANDDLTVLARQRSIADIRLRAAQHALTAYDESVAQLEEILAFERDRVTNLGLQTRLAEGLRRLYRVAYGHAMALARLAARAYRYERSDDTAVLAPSYWDPSVSGFLAGERLLSDLQALDRRYLESNHRELEVDQPFALSQIDPAALWSLRTSGSCTFTIPEVAFDTIYPGHWRRRLRAVRLTVPCVTGPYVNVGATLTLDSSQVRPRPDAALVPVPRAHGTAIATSTAQADGGVFELSFRDERYLPFEGQGAVSTWTLTLPGTVRAFDYASITDVIVSLAYSARADADRRQTVEGTGPGSILKYYKDTATTRIVSLRDELGSTFVRLLRTDAGGSVSFALGDELLAPVFRGRPVNISEARIGLRLAPGAAFNHIQLALDGGAAASFAVPSPNTTPGIVYADVPWTSAQPWSGDHQLTVVSAGEAGQPPQLDPSKILDVLLVMPIKLA